MIIFKRVAETQVSSFSRKRDYAGVGFFPHNIAGEFCRLAPQDTFAIQLHHPSGRSGVYQSC